MLSRPSKARQHITVFNNAVCGIFDCVRLSGTTLKDLNASLALMTETFSPASHTLGSEEKRKSWPAGCDHDRPEKKIAIMNQRVAGYPMISLIAVALVEPFELRPILR